MRDYRRYALETLHIVTLASFAIAQPLFHLFANAPEFFTARRALPVDVFSMVFTLMILLPLLIALLRLALLRLGEGVGEIAQAVILGLLFGLFCLPIVKNIEALSSFFIFALCLLAGGAVTYLYLKNSKPIKMFLTVVSPALLIFPGMLIFNSPVNKVVFPEKPPEATSIDEGGQALDRLRSHAKKKLPSIFFLVFDELSLVPLLDRDLNIDATRFPNFAKLVSHSHWFRNGSAVSDRTVTALPALLSGRYPSKKNFEYKLPVLADYKRTLFTLLEKDYQLIVEEPITQLAPRRSTTLEVGQRPYFSRLRSMLRDSWLVYLHVLLPASMTEKLPSVRHNWVNFVRIDPVEEKKFASGGKYIEYIFRQLKGLDHSQKFRDFINVIYRTESPSLYFLHIMFPHVPLQFLPNGDYYTGKPNTLFGLGPNIHWEEHRFAARQAYQRYLLQVGFLDKLLGEFIARLKDQELYDESIIVATADHGVSYKADTFRRLLNRDNAADILSVPIVIKDVGQTKGKVYDNNVETIDIVPTLVDMLGIKTNWFFHGSSAILPGRVERKSKVAYRFLNVTTLHRYTFPRSIIWPITRSVIEKTKYFPAGQGFEGIYDIAEGYLKAFLGKNLTELEISQTSNIEVHYDNHALYQSVDPESGLVPQHVTGYLVFKKKMRLPLDFALAINGTVRAMGTITNHSDYKETKALFSAIAPRTAFNDGPNRLDLVFIRNEGKKLSCVGCRNN